MNTIGVFINPNNLAITQFNNFPFNGACCVAENACAVNEDAVYNLFTGSLDGAAKISSRIVFGPTDFGVHNPKRARIIEIGCKCEGTLNVTITDEENRSFTKSGITNTHLFIPEEMIIVGDRNVRGRYLTIAIENVDGCNFELLSVNVTLTIMRPVRG